MSQVRDDYADRNLPPPWTPWGWVRRRWKRLAVAALAVCVPLAFVVGHRMGQADGERQERHRRFVRERDAFTRVRGADPAFSRVQLSEGDDGGMQVTGVVPTWADWHRLSDGYRALFGLGEAWRFDVAVERPAVPSSAGKDS